MNPYFLSLSNYKINVVFLLLLEQEIIAYRLKPEDGRAFPYVNEFVGFVIMELVMNTTILYHVNP